MMVLGASARCPAVAHQHRGRALRCPPHQRCGATTAHRHRGRAPGVLHTSGAGCADDWLGVSSRSPARPCRRVASFVGPGRCVCRWAAARPLAVRAASCARSGRSRSPARPCRRPPAPRPGPPAPSTPAGPGVLVCCSSFRNLACNSPPALCWFVSVCDVTPLVFVNCMRLLLSAGPAVAHRHRGWAVLTFPVLQADQTGCVRG